MKPHHRTPHQILCWLISFAWIFTCGLLSGSSALAQTPKGTILGTVKDARGGVVPGVTVTVTNLGTNVSQSYVTDDTGTYVVSSLQPGQYRVTAELPGFKRAIITGIDLQVEQKARVDITLEVGEISTTVEVTGRGPMVQTDTVTLGQVIADRQVTQLPLNGRDYRNLLKLNAGVTELQAGIATAIRAQGLNDTYRSVSINGARPSSISYVIDGVTINDSLFQSPIAIPPADSIQEFKLQNGLYSAEFGMGAGQVNIALRSGTNAFHGSLYDFVRNDVFQGKNPRSHQKDILKQNQYGGTIGGPIWRDRTFFFGSYEGGRRRLGALGEAFVPTEQEKQGNFSDWPVQLYNPLTGVLNPGGTPPVNREAFAGNQIPSTLIAPQSAALLKFWPKANLTCNPLPCTNFRRSFSRPIDVDTFTTRVDHNFSTSDKLFGQFIFLDNNSPAPGLIPLSGSKVNQRARVLGLQWTHAFSPRMLNEARFGYNRAYFLSGFETSFGSINYWKEAGLKNLRDDPAYFALPAIIIGTSGYAPIGNGGSLPFYNVTNIFQYGETFSYTKGRHTLKIGADIRRNHNLNQNGFGGNGLLAFTGWFTARNPVVPQVPGKPDTGNSFADFLLGYPSGAPPIRFTPFDQSYSALRNTDWQFFFHDDFRVHSQLTLNLGLRYELHTPFIDQSGGGRIFDFSFSGGRILYFDKKFVEAFDNPIIAACCVKRTLIDIDKKNWAPRVGLAWRPFAGNNNFVVRAGYGIFYDVFHAFYNTQSVARNIPFLLPSLPTPTGSEERPPLDIRNLFPAPYSISLRKFPPPYCQAPSSEVRDPNTGIITAVLNACSGNQSQLPDNKTPYTQQWALNLQYQLPGDLMLELGYQGARGLRQPIQWIFNQAFPPPEVGNPNHSATFRSQCPPGTYPDKCSPIQDRVPYKNFIRNAFANANILQSTYHGMTFKAEKRFSQGLQFLGAFTWSRTLDEFSEIQAVGGSVSSILQNAHNIKAERGPANFDQTRRLVMSGLYELPFGRGKKLGPHDPVLGNILGGWQASAIVTFADGTPFTVGCFCGDRSQTGNIFNTERMNVTGKPLPDGFQRTIFKQFDTSVFATPPLGAFGNSGRNTLRSTGQRAADLSFLKNNRFKERYNVELRAEIFNFLSSYRYFPRFPVNNAQSIDFGSLVSTRGGDKGNLWSPRTIQLALRLTF